MTTAIVSLCPPLYDDPTTSMETILDNMWNNNRSDVFSFSIEDTMDLENRKTILFMVATSSANETER